VWDVQIAPPTWGANYAVPDLSPEYVGDDSFRSLAHSGANGMFVYGDWVLYAKDTRFPEIEQPNADAHFKTLREATQRAAKYGIKIYFVVVSPKLPGDHKLFQRLPRVRGAKIATPAGDVHGICSSSPDGLAFHAEVMGRLFKEVPELGGIICIIGGESYYHCFMRVAGAPIGETNCPNCKGKHAETEIANFMKVTADAVTAVQPKAKVMAWPYSAAYVWSKEHSQLELIDRLSPNVQLLSEIDKEQTVWRGGLRKLIWDYSVDYEGHSDRIVAQADRCAKRGHELFIKTETSHGIELLHLPYVPALVRSAQQWQNIRALRPKGVLQRWGFIGMFDSAAERIGYQARWDPNFAPENSALSVARQLVGPDLATPVVTAWRHFSDAVHHIPILTTGPYYVGPAFLGPCHPLPVWSPTGTIPTAFFGNLYYLQETEASFNNARIEAKDNLVLTTTGALGAPADKVQAEFERARDAAAAGHKVLQALKTDGLPPNLKTELIEQQAIGEYLYRTFRTTVNVIYYIRLREGNVPDADARYNELAKDELENTKAAGKVYEVAPWLNHRLRLDVGVNDSVKMIDEKVKLLEGFLARK
jgi:hypothetical protein